MCPTRGWHHRQSMGSQVNCTYPATYHTWDPPRNLAMPVDAPYVTRSCSPTVNGTYQRYPLPRWPDLTHIHTPHTRSMYDDPVGYRQATWPPGPFPVDNYSTAPTIQHSKVPEVPPAPPSDKSRPLRPPTGFNVFRRDIRRSSQCGLRIPSQTQEKVRFSPKLRSHRSASPLTCSEESSRSSSSESEDEDYDLMPRRQLRRMRRDSPRHKSPPAPRLLTFDGHPREWENFVFSFEAAINQYQWDRQHRLQRLIECLRGKAVHYIRTLPPTTRSSYKRVKMALNERFGADEQPHLARKGLFELRQEPHEKTEDFADRVQEQVGVAFGPHHKSISDDVGVDVFVKGLRERAIAAQTAKDKPRSTRAALQAAKENLAIMQFVGRPPPQFRSFSDLRRR